MAAIILNNENFEAEVLKADLPVLVDFWAPWCGHCRMVSPLVDQVADEATNAKVCKVDVDENPDLSQKYGVMSIPTLIVFKNGIEVQRAVGALHKNAIMDMLKV
jgi:thioredoxin 1